MSMQEVVDLIRIFVVDPDYEVRADHVHDQIQTVRNRRKHPRTGERLDMRSGCSGTYQSVPE